MRSGSGGRARDGGAGVATERR
uniref:Uncharacterized protein n=1 Tax=Arundo donax TaxID=35708 RepID=A0A0A8Y9Y8_ARUDO